MARLVGQVVRSHCACSPFGIQFTANWSWIFLRGPAGVCRARRLPRSRAGLEPADAVVDGPSSRRCCRSSACTCTSWHTRWWHPLRHPGQDDQPVPAGRHGAHLARFAVAARGAPDRGGRAGVEPADRCVAVLLSWGLWGIAPPLAALGLWLATMNIPLAIFNLVPAYPLDGGRSAESACCGSPARTIVGAAPSPRGWVRSRRRRAVYGRVPAVRARRQRSAGCG